MVSAVVFIILLVKAWTKCSVCNLGGSLWSYNTTSDLYCPYSSICSNGCFKCSNDNTQGQCIDTSVVMNCISNTRICSSSYYSASSGNLDIEVPFEVLCYWQLDLRSFNKNTDFVEISISDSTISMNDMIFVIVYSIPYTDGIPKLRDYIGSLYTLNRSYIKLQGNYVVVAYWQDSENEMLFSLKWATQNANSDSIKIFLIVGIFVPCFVLCCCVICLYSYYRRKISRRAQAQVHYQVMNRTEQINDSYIEQQLPTKYFLLQEKVICPICFDNLVLGDQIRETDCKHIFHVDCIDEWIESKPSQYVCPVCKARLFDIEQDAK